MRTRSTPSPSFSPLPAERPKLSAPVLSWLAHVEAWRRSGVSARAYGEQHKLTPSTLYSWRRRLRAEKPSTPPPRILPVSLSTEPDCCVELSDGRRLRFPQSLPPEVLRSFLDALERR